MVNTKVLLKNIVIACFGYALMTSLITISFILPFTDSFMYSTVFTLDLKKHVLKTV